jgi:hypothetical protein
MGNNKKSTRLVVNILREYVPQWHIANCWQQPKKKTLGKEIKNNY